jgi:DNA repair protein RecO (recombination protein O)
MKTYTVEAFVLRMRPLGEADRILTLFSRERGKLEAVAKGARKTQSKFGARLDFFNRSRITLHAGRTLDVITGAEALSHAWQRLVEPDTYVIVSYIAEMVDALCEPELALPELYQLLSEVQSAVAAGMDAAAFVAAADMRLLKILGFAPELDACARCGAALQGRPLGGGRATLSPQAGGLVCRRCTEAGFRGEGFDRYAHTLTLSVAEFAALRMLAGDSLAQAAASPLGPRLSFVTRSFVEYNCGRRSKAMAVSNAQKTAPTPSRARTG